MLFEQAAVGVAQVESKSARFMKVNLRFCSIVGYTAEELQELTFSELTHSEDMVTEESSRQFSAQGQLLEYSVDKRLQHKNGTFVWVNQTVTAIQNADEQPGYEIVVIQDITERKHMEERIRTDIREKEILLQEVHHRVKNNMQVIISLLDLQIYRTQDPLIVESFKTSKDRIYSMALVHEMLYQSHDLSKIDFSQYIENLAWTIFSTFGVDPARVRLELHLQPILLKVDYAVPCGLIVHELVSNAIKYAFPANWNKKAKIRILFRRIKNEIELQVTDNGISLPEIADINELHSLGLKLVHMLGERQLKGKIEIIRDKGTQISLRFLETRDS
jgi:PAS domain S-box-containing protein